LSDDEVIRFIAQNFVPVAENLYRIREAKDAGGEFFRAVQKQRPAQYQGLYVVAPDGKVLSSHQQYKSEKTWPKEVLAALREGAKAFGEIQPRNVQPEDPLPQRGIGLRADRSATLAIYARLLLLGLRKEGFGPVTLDSLTLPERDWTALAPVKVDPGSEWTLPEAVARQFSRVCGPSNEDSMPRPNEVTSVRLTGRVRSVEDEIAYVTYEGKIAGAHKTQAGKVCRGEASLTGVGAYDTKGGRMLSLTFVFDGTYRNVPPYDQPAKYGAVVEWRR
jgi:hypothetical protein